MATPHHLSQKRVALKSTRISFLRAPSSWKFAVFHTLFRPRLKDLDGSKFVPSCHHCGVISHIICSMLKREQNHIARSLPKMPNRPKQIFCHHYGAFGHLRLDFSKFQALKRIKIKEKLELLGSCAKKAKPDF